MKTYHICEETMRRLLGNLIDAAEFIAGFKEDETQEGIDELSDSIEAEVKYFADLLGEPRPVVEVIDCPPTPEGYGIIRRALDEAGPIKALTAIATIEADSNSDPEVMGRALDEAVGVAQGALRELKNPTHPSEWPFFTVFVRQGDGEGTTYITSCQCPDIETAKKQALEECFTDWGWADNEDYALEDLVVVGVAGGNVHILEWNE